jgi:hypothetical protein
MFSDDTIRPDSEEEGFPEQPSVICILLPIML